MVGSESGLAVEAREEYEVVEWRDVDVGAVWLEFIVMMGR